MRLMTAFRNNSLTAGIYAKARERFFEAVSVVSPVWNTKLRYRAGFGRKLDLKNPRTLNEKISWLKLNRYMKDPLVIRCADKYLVREYVEQCGCGDILNELYGVYRSADEICWEDLPQQFVLKWNFGAGMNYVCMDKDAADRDAIIAQFRAWGKVKYWLSHSEFQYRYIPRRIVCERLLGAETIEEVTT